MFFVMHVYRSLFLIIWASESGCLGLQNVREVWQKPASHICRDYADFDVIFIWFSMALGSSLVTWVAWRQA